MTTEKETYQGWTNYETWAWKLWQDNDEPSYRACRMMARQCLDDAEPQLTREGSELFSREEVAIQALADQMKQAAEENAPELAGPYADLMSAALSEINWREIATAWIEDVGKEV